MTASLAFKFLDNFPVSTFLQANVENKILELWRIRDNLDASMDPAAVQAYTAKALIVVDEELAAVGSLNAAITSVLFIANDDITRLVKLCSQRNIYLPNDVAEAGQIFHEAGTAYRRIRRYKNHSEDCKVALTNLQQICANLSTKFQLCDWAKNIS
jgi:hypothetical protein